MIKSHITKITYGGAALLIVIIFGTIYASVQTSIRAAANDPQTQLSEDMANQLEMGSDYRMILGSDKVHLASSLSPFISIYDQSGNVLSSSGELDGKTPALSIGILRHATMGNDNIVTAEPKPGVRLAVVVASYSKGYVISGRSLREAEKLEALTAKLCGLGLSASLLVLAVIYALRSRSKKL